MRNLFIGCGVVVVLILGVLGYMTYQLYPHVKEWQTEWVAAIEELNELDDRYPFDGDQQEHVDTQRFASALDLRVELARYLRDVEEELADLAHSHQNEELGFLGLVKGMFGTAAPMLHEVAYHLEQAEMSPSEFSWHTRVLWATLARVDAGAAGPELSLLDNRYGLFRESYARLVREQPGLTPLDELLSGLPPAILDEAAAVLALDIDRVLDGLDITEVDHIYMQPVRNLQDLRLPGHVVGPPDGAEPAPGY